MGLIKKQSAKPLLKNAIVLDMGDLQKQADRILEDARKRADAMVAEAEQTAAKLADQAHAEAAEAGRRQGHEEGFAAGQAEGHDQAFAQCKSMIEKVCFAWREGAGQWESQLAEMHKEGRQAVLDLAIAMAKKVVHRVVEVDDKVIVDQLAGVLAQILRPVDANVRICSEDRPVLEEVMADLLEEFNQLKHVHLLEDSSIARGGCVVNFGQGRIDATIDKQLDRLVAAMLPGGTAVAEGTGQQPKLPSEASQPAEDEKAEPDVEAEA